PHALVKAVPALPLRGEHPVRLGFHVERSKADPPLRPLQAPRLAGVDPAEVALTAEGLDPEPRSDDLRGLDGPWDDAGEQDIGPYAARHRKVVPQRSSLLPAAIGQAGAPTRPREH